MGHSLHCLTTKMLMIIMDGDDNNFGYSHLDIYNGHITKTQNSNTILTTQGYKA